MKKNRDSKQVPKSKDNPLRDLLQFEQSLYRQGFERIAGVDEVGRACLAGPVFAAAVILPKGCFLPEVDDSKKLTPQVRERLYPEICKAAIAWSVAQVSSEEIDQINIHRASLKAMKLAIEALLPIPEYVLIDGKFLLESTLNQKAIVEGDALSQSIAAASIVAKVTRDRWMAEEGQRYPEYNFAQHKGYGTKQHKVAIQKYGLTPLHRRSFNHS